MYVKINIYIYIYMSEYKSEYHCPCPWCQHMMPLRESSLGCWGAEAEPRSLVPCSTATVDDINLA